MFKLNQIIIFLKSLTVLLIYSIKILYYAKRNQLNNEKLVYCQHYLASKLIHIVQATYKVNNAENIKIDSNRPCIIMSNHSSAYDIPFIFSIFSLPVFTIGRRTLSNIPVIGRAMLAGNMLPIDRKNLEQAEKDYQAIKKRMEDKILLYVCPEGTRSASGSLQSFEMSAFRLAREIGALIIPIGLKGTANILPARTLHFELKKHVEINIGQSIDASGYNAVTQIQLVKHVAETIRSLTGEITDKEIPLVKYNLKLFE
jgi:1-acyl-sn-glycerol-3-phosphate acyltransferase